MSRTRLAAACPISFNGTLPDMDGMRVLWHLLTIMKYPIAIESGYANHAYGVVVPDLPGCFSAGDTLDEAIDNAKEAGR
jgi:hypothetical protein